MKWPLRLLWSIALVLAVWLGRERLYGWAVGYEIVRARQSVGVPSPELRAVIEAADTYPAESAYDLIPVALAVTCDRLVYAIHPNTSDPNRLLHTHTAHCVGYAAFFATVYNHLLRRQGFVDWVATAEVGRIYLFGTNVHRFFTSPFLADHDFVVIRNRRTGVRMAVDPSLSDFLGIDHVRLR